MLAQTDQRLRGILTYSVSALFQTGELPPGNGLPAGAALEFARAARRSRPDRKTADKAKRPPVRSASYGRLLLFGKHRELALYRAAVLQHSGFLVATPRTRQEAIEAVRHGDFDAAILSYTLPADTVEELAEMVRQHCPACPLITISQERTHDARIDPDAIVLAGEGPQALLSALKRVLGRRPQ